MKKSLRKYEGRGIYSVFFGDFSRCSLLSHCVSLHKYSSDNKARSAISYRQRRVCGTPAASRKDDRRVPDVTHLQGGFKSAPQQQVVLSLPQGGRMWEEVGCRGLCCQGTPHGSVPAWGRCLAAQRAFRRVKRREPLFQSLQLCQADRLTSGACAVLWM